jgi:hypothetical protein
MLSIYCIVIATPFEIYPRARVVIHVNRPSLHEHPPFLCGHNMCGTVLCIIGGSKIHHLCKVDEWPLLYLEVFKWLSTKPLEVYYISVWPTLDDPAHNPLRGPVPPLPSIHLLSPPVTSFSELPPVTPPIQVCNKTNWCNALYFSQVCYDPNNSELDLHSDLEFPHHISLSPLSPYGHSFLFVPYGCTIVTSIPPLTCTYRFPLCSGKLCWIQVVISHLLQVTYHSSEVIRVLEKYFSIDLRCNLYKLGLWLVVAHSWYLNL